MHDKTRILLIEDHDILRFGLSQLLDGTAGFEVVGAVGTGREGMVCLRNNAIDLVMLDLTLPDCHGINLMREIKRKYPELPIIVLTMHDEYRYGARAIAAGASGYLMKTEKPATIINAAQAVARGGTYISESLRERLVPGTSDPSGSSHSVLDALSDRELEVLQMIGAGLGSAEIAERLRRSVKTIEAHREHIKNKLSLKNATELIRFAMSLHDETVAPSFGAADMADPERLSH